MTTSSTGSEHVKAGETVSYWDLMSASGVGWLIQATVGNFGGVGRWCRNRAGLAAYAALSVAARWARTSVAVP
jgi:hypothetical protein